MQTGTVLYLTDAPNMPDEVDDDWVITEAGLPPDWTVLAAAGGCWPPVEDAVRSLIVRGAHRVEAVTCRIEPDGRVSRFGAPLRVFG